MPRRKKTPSNKCNAVLKYTKAYKAKGDPLTKRLQVVGNSLAIIIDKPILKLLQIDVNTRVELRTDGKQLLITPLREFNCDIPANLKKKPNKGK